MASSFDPVLERLVASYERGRLVPFIGAGLSIPACQGWAGFIEGLEREAGLDGAGERSDPDALIRRAYTAVRTLRLRSPERFPDTVRRALAGRTPVPPPQTVALARVWWPLLLTTNYDNCFVTAYRAQQRGRNIDVLGREPFDCQRVLSALSSSSRTILWALQGFVGAPCPPPQPGRLEARSLARQLVIGHAEYRSVTHRALHFRRAFAEVFRSRSLLFVGSGLRDQYLLDLFGEILETYGASEHPHYALVRRGELSPSQCIFLRERYQTEIFEYRSHADLPRYLDRFADAVRTKSTREVRWSYSLAAPETPGPGEPGTDFEVVRARLPQPDPERRECLALSAGGWVGRFAFSPSIGKLLVQAGVARGEQPERPRGRYVARFGKRPIYGVLARTENDRHDLRIIAAASEELFDVAWRDGYRRVLMQLLAAGETRIFPVRMSFIQIARAFAAWRRRHPRRRLVLALHVIAPAVTEEIARERLDVIELLACRDIRYWVIVDNGHDAPERILRQDPADFPLGAVREALAVPSSAWEMEVYPKAFAEKDRSKLAGRLRTLQSHGVVPGSTVVFRRRLRRR